MYVWGSSNSILDNLIVLPETCVLALSLLKDGVETGGGHLVARKFLLKVGDLGLQEGNLVTVGVVGGRELVDGVFGF